ncbi:MAG: hypothetical protein DWQ19_11450 [Crenarchaeota archaeon]|nr:MAG: hypothetical protein DWQ19_11450 [Thermoproteota archaeon]
MWNENFRAYIFWACMLLLGGIIFSALVFPRTSVKNEGDFMEKIADHGDLKIYKLKVDNQEYIVNGNGGIIKHEQTNKNE